MKLEFIKDKVKQACPEIMELSFGCEVEADLVGGQVFGKVTSIRGEWGKEDFPGAAKPKGMFLVQSVDIQGFTTAHQRNHGDGVVSIPLKDYQSYVCVPYKMIKNIIGHPIQLSHVLRTIEFKKSGCHSEAILQAEKEVGKLMRKWNLTKPLDEQSEGVINFLYDILK